MGVAYHAGSAVLRNRPGHSRSMLERRAFAPVRPVPGCSRDDSAAPRQVRFECAAQRQATERPAVWGACVTVCRWSSRKPRRGASRAGDRLRMPSVGICPETGWAATCRKCRTAFSLVPLPPLGAPSSPRLSRHPPPMPPKPGVPPSSRSIFVCRCADLARRSGTERWSKE